jgi:MFS family permease
MTTASLWTRPFCILTLSHLLGALGYASMLLLPLYLTHLGGTRAEVGLIMSAAHIAGLLTRPFVGWSLDRFGRKSSLIFGGVVTAVSLAMIHWVNAIDYSAYGVRILFGIGEGFIFTGYFALAADLIPQSRRTEGLALFGVAGLLPLLVNPIADITGFQGSSIRPFLTAVSLLVLLSAALIFFIPAKMKSSQQTDLSSEKGFKGDIAHTAMGYLLRTPLRPLWWSTIAFAGAVSILMTFASVIGASRGMTYPTAVWFTYVAGAVSARLFGAKLPERLGPAKLVSPSLALYGLALLTYSLSTDLWGMLTAGVLAGVAHGYCFPVLTSLIVSAVDDHYRGRALAMFTGLWGGAAMIFAPLGGMIADHWGDQEMLFTFGICLLFTALYARAHRFTLVGS